ncbi:MAG: hypothetical protein ACOYL8_04595 [Patescibacteria group bacterium]
MAKEKFVVTGNQRDEIDGQMLDIKRQLRLKNGSPLDPELVKSALQLINERTFPVVKNILSEIIHSSYVRRQDYFWLVSEHFFANANFEASVRIGSVTEEFKKNFGDLSEKIKTPYFIKGRISQISCSGRRIVSEIKKESNSFDVSLSNIYGLMQSKQRDLSLQFGNMSEGLSLENDNIFFVKDKFQLEVRQVILHWHNLGWAVDSKPLVEEIKAGSRVFYGVLNKA